MKNIVKIIKNMNSKEIETFIQDVRDDISNNLEGLFGYYGFLENHNIMINYGIKFYK